MTSFVTVAAGQPIRSTHVNQFTRWITGALVDIPFTPVSTSSSAYTATLTNRDTTQGLLLSLQYGASGAETSLLTVNRSLATLNTHLKLGAGSTLTLPTVTTPSAPGVSLAILYPKTDGNWYTRFGAAGSETLLGTGTGAAVDGYGFLGYDPVVNGNMDSWPQGGTFNATTDGTYLCDQFVWNQASTAGIVNITQSTDVPQATAANDQPTYSIKVAVTTADAAVAAGDVAYLTHKMEGYQFRKLRGRAFVLPFWVRSTMTGVHCVAVSNGTDRTYVVEYSVTSADTWESKSIAVTASPSADTWNYGTGLGLNIHWVLMAGSSLQTAAGTWTSGLRIATSNQVNCLSTTANIFQLALVGPPAPGTSALTFVSRSYDENKLACWRYFQKSGPDGVTALQSSFNGMVQFQVSDNTTSKPVAYTVGFPVEMRTTPTVRVADLNNGLDKISTLDAGGNYTNAVTPSPGIGGAIGSIGARGFLLAHTGTIAGFAFGWQASARL